jgi:hypothetical protein
MTMKSIEQVQQRDFVGERFLFRLFHTAGGTFCGHPTGLSLAHQNSMGRDNATQ